MTPVLPDTLEVALCKGLLARLDGAGIITWREDAAYGDGFPGIAGFLASWPNGPDCIVAATPYGVTDDPEEPMSRIGVQMRTRWAGGNPRGVLNLSGAIFDALHGLGPVVLSTGVSVSQCLRASSASLGQDVSSKRWSWSDNYYVDVDRPSANRT